MPIASGKPDSRMRINPNSFDAAPTSEVRLKDAYVGGLMEKQRGKPRPTILRLRSDTTNVDWTPTHNTHLCNTVCSEKVKENTRLAQVITDCISSLWAWKESVIWCCTCLNLCCSLTCRLPRAHHLPYSLFPLPRHKNTKSTQYITHISKLSQSTCCAIKNHSGVKTCRVAETRAQQLTQVMSPKNLRPSRESTHMLEIQINYMMYRKNLEKKITSSYHRRKWRNLEKLGRLVCPILNYQRRLPSNRWCISTIPWKALQILISRVKSYKRCWLHHCMPRKRRGKHDAMVVQEREVSAQYTQAERKERLRSHSSEGKKALGNPTHCFHLSREIWSGVLCSETLIRQIWDDLFLKEIRITCSIRQAQTWRNKNFMSNLSISASVNYNDKRKSIDWRYRTHNTDLLNPDENKFDYKKNCL